MRALCSKNEESRLTGRFCQCPTERKWFASNVELPHVSLLSQRLCASTKAYEQRMEPPTIQGYIQCTDPLLIGRQANSTHRHQQPSTGVEGQVHREEDVAAVRVEVHREVEEPVLARVIHLDPAYLRCSQSNVFSFVKDQLVTQPRSASDGKT